MKTNKIFLVKGVLLVVCLLNFMYLHTATAAQYNWNGGTDNFWGTPANWLPNAVPGPNDTAIFNATSNVCNLNGNITVKSLLFTGNYTGQFYSNYYSIRISQDADFSSGSYFVFMSTDSIIFTGTGTQKFTPKSSMTFPILVQEGTGTTTVKSVGFTAQKLIIKNGTFLNGYMLTDTIMGHFLCEGGSLGLNSGTFVVMADVNFTGLQGMVDGTGVLRFSGAAQQSFYSNDAIITPAVYKDSPTELVVRNNRLITSCLKIQNGGTVTMDTSLRTDSLILNPGTTIQLDTTSTNSDTVNYVNIQGNINIRNSELCFTSVNVDLSLLNSLTSWMNGAIAFIGTNQSFIPSATQMYNKIRQRGTGPTTITTNGLRVDTLELISGQLHLGNGLNDSLNGAIKMNGGTLNFGSSVLKVGAMDLNLNGSGTIIPETGVLEFGGYYNHTFTPALDGIHPRISIVANNTKVIGNHLKATSVYIQNGSLEMDTSCNIDTLYLAAGVSLTLDSAFGNSDTIHIINGTGTLSLRKSELCFSGPNIDLSQLNYMDMYPEAAITFIGTNQSFIPSATQMYHKIRQRGTGQTIITTNGLRVDTLELISGQLHLGNGLNDSLNGAIKMNGGTLNFGSSVLKVGAANLDLSGSGTIIPGTGVLEFSSIIDQYFTPAIGVMHPKIVSNSNRLRIVENHLRTSKVTVLTDTLKMRTTLNADTIDIADAGYFRFDTTDNKYDTIGDFRGMGKLEFGKTNVQINENADFSSFTSISGTGNINLNSTITQTLHPHQYYTFNTIKQTGTGTVTVESNRLLVNNLAIETGTWNWGTATNDTINDTLLIVNGTMNLGSNVVFFESLINTAGTLYFADGQLIKIGNSGIINFGVSSVIVPDNGILAINGMSGSKTILSMQGTGILPKIIQNGNDTVVVQGNVTSHELFIQTGVWDWGIGNTHNVSWITSTGGEINFNSSVVRIDSANFQNFIKIMPGTGGIEFSTISGTHFITPHTTDTLPAISHTGNDDLKINTNTLLCQSFTETGKSLDFNGCNITASGNIQLSPDTLILLGGRTIAAGGNIILSGSVGDLLYCNPGVSWNVNAGGLLSADYAVLSFSSATGVQGVASMQSVDNGSNSNWVFITDNDPPDNDPPDNDPPDNDPPDNDPPDNDPPDNDVVLTVTALDTGRIILEWDPSLIDSTDAYQVGIWYKTGTYPTSVNDETALLAGNYSMTDTIDTIEVLSHTHYYFALSVVDTMGNWAAFTNSSRAAIITPAKAPVIISSPDTVHNKTFPVVFSNPPGLLVSDSIYIHVDTVNGSNWVLQSTFNGTLTSISVFVPSVEGVYKYMISNSFDSAGVNYSTDAAYDTVCYDIKPPVIYSVTDTTDTLTIPVVWAAPVNMMTSDSFFVYTDTINESYGWTLFGKYSSTTTTALLNFSRSGDYIYMVATSWDSIGSININNVAIDTVYIRPPSKQLDTVAPAVEITFPDAIHLNHVPATIIGSANDSNSGISSISLLIYHKNSKVYWNGTSWSSGVQWLPLAISNNWVYTNTMSLIEGDFVVKAGVFDSAGNVMYDTAFFSIDTTAPKAVVSTEGIFSAQTWPGFISGTVSVDSSGIDSILIKIKNTQNHTSWNGTGWDTSGHWNRITNSTMWSYPLAGKYLSTSTYEIIVYCIDGAGNIQSVVDTQTFSYDQIGPSVISFSINDTDGYSRFGACDFLINVDSCDSMRIGNAQDTLTSIWTKYVSAYSFTLSGNEGVHNVFAQFKDRAGNRSVWVHDSTIIDTTAPALVVSGGTIDSNGNWSGLIEGTASDVVSGVKVVLVQIQNSNALFWNDSAWSPIESWIECEGTSSWKYYLNSSMLSDGTYTLKTGAQDFAGNRSAYISENVEIKKPSPIIQPLQDTTVFEKKLLSITLPSINNDITVSLAVKPEGCILDGTVIKWTPKNVDVGRHSVVVEYSDKSEKTVLDTFIIIVKNIPESPEISYVGSLTLYVDSLYSATFTISDPDIGDTHTIASKTIPSWMTLSGTTLTGTPLKEHVGIHELEFICTDKDTLKDTVKVQLLIVNTNNRPSIEGTTVPDTMIEKTKYSAVISVFDPDSGDSITMTTVANSSWVRFTSIEKLPGTGTWNIHCEFSPIQNDTGMQEITIQIADRSGAFTVFNKKVFVLDENDPPKKPLLLKKTGGGAVQFVASSSDDYDEQLQYVVKAISLKDNSIIYSDTTTQSLFTIVALVDGQYTIGVTAIDAAGLHSEIAIDTFNISGASIHTWSDTTWSMVSIPSKGKSIDYLTNSNYLLNWDESGVDKQVFSYYKKKDEITTLAPSKSYWRKGDLPDKIKLSKDDFITEPVQVQLHKKTFGWNQIASPYPFPVAWTRKDDVLWRWNAATKDYEEVVHILEPWKGYWVKVDTSAQTTLYPIPVFYSGTLSKLSKSFFSDRNNWNVQVALNSDNGKDSDNRFGFHPKAADMYDKLDRSEPPRIDGGAVLYFPHNDWNVDYNKFASDIRKNWKPVNVFEIALSGYKDKGEGVLTFDGIELTKDIYMFLILNDSAVKIEPDKGYQIPLSKDISYHTVFVTSDAQFNKTVPLRFAMGNPYPNPFCPSTKINYTLPYRWDSNGKIVLSPYVVSIEIYDIMGRKLRQLIYRKMTPGNYSVAWDGKMESGRIVASGNYYCVLRAGDLKDVKQLIMLK